MRVLANRELNKDLPGELLSIGPFKAVRLMCTKDAGLKIKLENETQFWGFHALQLL